MRTDGETCPYWWIWSESIFLTTVAISEKFKPKLALYAAFLTYAPCFIETRREPLTVVSHRWREMAARRWSVTPVRSHGRLTQHGRKWTFFFFSFFSPSPHWMMDSSAAQRRRLQEPPRINRRVTLTGPWLTLPTKVPPGSRKNRLRANSVTFSNRCLCLERLTLGGAFTAALSTRVRGRDQKTARSFSCTIIRRRGLKQQPLLHIKTWILCYKLCFVEPFPGLNVK